MTSSRLFLRAWIFPAVIGSSAGLHGEDLAKGFGEVFLPTALVKKYPSASRRTGGQLRAMAL